MIRTRPVLLGAAGALVAAGLVAVVAHDEDSGVGPCRLNDLVAPDASGVTAMHQNDLILDLRSKVSGATCFLLGPLQIELHGASQGEVARGTIYTTDKETGSEAALTVDRTHSVRVDLSLGPSSDVDDNEIVCDQEPSFEVREVTIRRLTSREAVTVSVLHDQAEQYAGVCGGGFGGSASGSSTHPLT